jgi:hypothetical protein
MALIFVAISEAARTELPNPVMALIFVAISEAARTELPNPVMALIESPELFKWAASNTPISGLLGKSVGISLSPLRPVSDSRCSIEGSRPCLPVGSSG